MGKIFEQALQNGKYRNGQLTCKKMSLSLVSWEMQIKTKMSYYYNP